MDLDKSKQFCGTCSHWSGKRDCDEQMCRVSPSARGSCEKLKKTKIAQGACDLWTELGGGG